MHLAQFMRALLRIADEVINNSLPSVFTMSGFRHYLFARHRQCDLVSDFPNPLLLLFV